MGPACPHSVEQLLFQVEHSSDYAICHHRHTAQLVAVVAVVAFKVTVHGRPVPDYAPSRQPLVMKGHGRTGYALLSAQWDYTPPRTAATAHRVIFI